MLVDRGRYERSKSELGAHEVERLAQVRGVQQEYAIGLCMRGVLPEVSGEACRHQEEHLRGREVRLAGRDLQDQL